MHSWFRSAIRGFLRQSWIDSPYAAASSGDQAGAILDESGSPLLDESGGFVMEE